MGLCVNGKGLWSFLTLLGRVIVPEHNSDTWVLGKGALSAN